MAAFLLAPFRWVFGDVRWGLLVCQIAAGWIIWLAGRLRGDQRTTTLLAVLLLLAPGALVLVENAWNEPLVFVLLGGALVAFDRGRALPGIVLLALALATKQHVLLVLPVLAVWGKVGLKGVAASFGLALTLCLPWAVASPSAFWHGVVAMHERFAPRKDSSTAYILALRSGWTTGLGAAGALILLAAIVYAARRIRRPDVEMPQVAVAAAFVLLVANMVNKQAFINQYWLVGALILLGLVGPHESSGGVQDRPDARRLPRGNASFGPAIPASQGSPAVTHGPSSGAPFQWTDRGVGHRQRSASAWRGSMSNRKTVRSYAPLMFDQIRCRVRCPSYDS
jgi:hypothetical protein